jgi:type I restriction enzyme S subunit
MRGITRRREDAKAEKTVIAIDQRRLKFVATINDESLTEATEPDYELQYIDIGNVDSYGTVHDVVAYKFEDAPSRARRIVRHGDVIISTVRTYLQAIAPIENPPENLIVSTGFAVIRPDRNIFGARFCKYAVREKHFLWEVESRSTGVSYPAINASDLADIRISLPHLETQHLIADYLDRETARIDALVAEKEKMLALLEEKRAALISRAVTRGLNPDAPLKPSGARWFDETPQGWSVERLKWTIKSVTSGVSVNASDQPMEGDGFGVLKTSAVSGGRFMPSENKSVWDSEYDRLACPVTHNTIIMSRMNTPALVGESGYVESDHPNLFLPDRLWQLSFNDERVHVPFMALLLSSKEARNAVSSMATGTSPSMKNLAIEEMSSLLTPIPPIQEQREIYGAVSRQDAIIYPLKKELLKSLQILKERRAALITAAVTGQIPIEEMSA